MTLTPALQKLIDALPPPERLTYLSIADAIYQARYTGFTGIHWLNGVPRQIDLGAPVRLTIVEALDSGGRNPSD